jgi:hypothetical protein
MRPNALVLSAVLLSIGPATAAQSDLPPPVLKGLTALQNADYETVGKEWAGTWTTAEASVSRDQVISSFRSFGTLAGPLSGYDIVKVLDVSPHLRRYYIVLLYKTQPAYLMLVVYHPGQEFTVTTLNWNTDPDKVFPSSIFPPQRPGGGV